MSATDWASIVHFAWCALDPDRPAEYPHRRHFTLLAAPVDDRLQVVQAMRHVN
ncbi:hypothetical protein [Arenicella chitinivorans]|uniref:hypothetical protein n=1 Tax=Arenicella chitinivorans TaxID=1329800 RepID=UPI001671F56E|nr:hypothetical protein [Arenicella chitinivorans]